MLGLIIMVLIVDVVHGVQLICAVGGIFACVVGKIGAEKPQSCGLPCCSAFKNKLVPFAALYVVPEIL